MNFQEILEYSFLNIGDLHLSLSHIIVAIIIISIARVFIWVLNRILTRFFKRRKIDAGRKYALLQFLKYIIYTIAILLAMEAMGMSVSVLMGGAAALMVGIGLGLQQTFNDLVSGIILLGEGVVEVGDFVEVDGIIGKVSAIGIRTSKVETRNSISILIPNSKLVGEKAINWTHNKSPLRFEVNIGIAYNSDVELATKLILQTATEHSKVLKTPKPEVQFVDFGSSSLDFTLLFFSEEYQRIEFVKSDIRYHMMKLFTDNKIEIPFPQRDLWLRNPKDLIK